MANIKSSIKRAKQNIVRNAKNAGQRSAFRTTLKKVLKAVETADKTTAKAAFLEAQRTIDKAVTKGLIHQNKADRHKSRLSLKVKALAA